MARDEGKTFFCHVDSHMATKDYRRGGRCVRFMGVRPQQFSVESLTDGIDAVTIDIDYWLYCQQEFNLSHGSAITKWHETQVQARDDDLSRGRAWFKVTVEPTSSNEQNYFYQTFKREAPTFCKLKEIARVDGPEIPPTKSMPTVSLESAFPGTAGKRPFKFDAFHVGQGMCSLVHNDVYGVLLDVGAGKPITRNRYQGAGLKNALIPILSGLERLDLVLSHADSDHWRMLSWDVALQSKVERIFVPALARPIAFKDRSVIAKTFAVGSFNLPLDSVTHLQVLRSQPAKQDSNGDCLVVTFNRAGERVLAAGDYVYKRLLTDGNPEIRRLCRAIYSGVVVPHHGDFASSKFVISPAKGARAFFSAGTHQGYGHPHSASLKSHTARPFVVISNRNERHIVRVPII